MAFIQTATATAAAVMAVMVVLLACLMTSCGSMAEDGIIVAGSTSVQPYAEVLAEEFAHLYADSEVDVQGGGSSAGITAAENGTADIGMSSRDLNEKERGMWSVEIAKDGLAIIVHPQNPIQGLTLDQVRGIYTKEIENWNQVGGQGAEIHIIAREDGSGTRSAFESLVMDTSRINPGAIVQDSNGSVRQIVSGDRNAIGFISLGLVDHTVKAVHLDGVAPTWENVVNKSYKLFRPFIFVADGQPEGLTKQFIDFTLSPLGQKLLSDEGLIPAS
jgi:phosphate transport system substrate-binding protein